MEIPRDYISYSQIRTFRKSPQEYYKRYVLGQDMYESKWLKYGKRFSEAVEDGGSDDEIIDAMVKEVTVYEGTEVEAKAETDKIDLPLFGYKDTAKDGAFREYKTGTKEWTQERVNNHEQLLMYALIDYLNTGEVPTVHLDWLPVEEHGDGSVSFTGELYTFERDISEEEVLAYIDEVKDVINAIRAYEPDDEVDLIELEPEKAGLFNQYMQLDKEIDQLEEKQDEVKEKVKQYMMDEAIQKVSADDGTFYQQTYKSYDYPEEVQEIKETLNEKRKQARENGEVDVSETTSISFRSN